MARVASVLYGSHEYALSVNMVILVVYNKRRIFQRLQSSLLLKSGHSVELLIERLVSLPKACQLSNALIKLTSIYMCGVQGSASLPPFRPQSSTNFGFSLLFKLLPLR